MNKDRAAMIAKLVMIAAAGDTKEELTFLSMKDDVAKSLLDGFLVKWW